AGGAPPDIDRAGQPGRKPRPPGRDPRRRAGGEHLPRRVRTRARDRDPVPGPRPPGLPLRIQGRGRRDPRGAERGDEPPHRPHLGGADVGGERVGPLRRGGLRLRLRATPRLLPRGRYLDRRTGARTLRPRFV
ncbi:MAG: hypothetical protein AVDCRST_MAG05-2203, partial [uncultured Rubrobacteraceae bacterium]